MITSLCSERCFVFSLMYGFHFVARLLQGLTTQYFQGNFVSIVYVCAL